jgi:hypothetical protein
MVNRLTGLLTGCGKTTSVRQNVDGPHAWYVVQEKNIPAGCSKSLSSKAAASEEARRTLRYVEPLSDARTPLAGFFSILLKEDTRGRYSD